jgi:hypothetical protein
MTEKDLFGSSAAGKKGGKAAAERMTPDQRRERARAGAIARWSKAGDHGLPVTVCGSADHPLKIGDHEIPCYVLEDGRRVLVQGGMFKALDMKQGTAGRGEGDRLTRFIATKALKDYVPEGISKMITEPIHFRVSGGPEAYGYEATILPELCEAVLDARARGKLNYQQEHIAQRCEELVRGLARVGIVALVDEATGYQAIRDRDALSKILEAFLQDAYAKWAKRFPDEFYKELFRLRGWAYSPISTKRPLFVGKLTADLVYDRLAPGIRAELERINPKDDQGRRRVRHHQWLTQDIGHPKLQEHLSAVIALMKASDSWDDLKKAINRALPKQPDMPLFPSPPTGAT